jgi:hypothetical protein
MVKQSKIIKTHISANIIQQSVELVRGLCPARYVDKHLYIGQLSHLSALCPFPKPGPTIFDKNYANRFLSWKKAATSRNESAGQAIEMLFTF